MHFHLTRSRAAAHAEIFECAAEARFLMALEVREGNDDVRVHQRPADLRVFHILAAHDRHFDIIAAAQAVCNDHVTAGGKRRKTV